MAASSRAIRASVRAVRLRVADDPGEVAQGLGHVGDPVETALEPGRTEGLLELAGHVDHGLGADHHVDLRAVHGLHLAEARVPGQGAEHAQPQLVEQRQDVPQLTGDVVLPHQGHIVDLESIPFDAWRHRVRLPTPADVLDHGVPGDAVAEVLGPVEAGRVHRHHRGPPALPSPPCTRPRCRRRSGPGCRCCRRRPPPGCRSRWPV